VEVAAHGQKRGLPEEVQRVQILRVHALLQPRVVLLNRVSLYWISREIVLQEESKSRSTGRKEIAK
jgi:hypothetical protein